MMILLTVYFYSEDYSWLHFYKNNVLVKINHYSRFHTCITNYDTVTDDKNKVNLDFSFKNKALVL